MPTGRPGREVEGPWCLDAPVIIHLFLFATGGLTVWLLGRRVRQRAARAARGAVIEVPCLLRHPARAGRWLRGRLVTGPGTAAWAPRTRAGAGLGLPAGIRPLDVRSPSTREAMRINAGCRIVECASDEGTVLLAVMPHELGHVLAALART